MDELKPLPKCVDCRHIKTEYTAIPTPKGNMTAKVFMCNHPAFLDPVNGEPMKCGDVRRFTHFCSMEGRGFEPNPAPNKEEENTNKRLVLVDGN